MKLSHKELTGQRDTQSDVSRRESGPVSRFAARCAIIGALAFASPLLGGTAFAQQPTPAPETAQPVAAAPSSTQPVAAAPSSARPEHRVRGETTTLTDGSTSISAYLVLRGSPTPSSIEVEGPAKVSVRFYPVVSRERFATPQVDVQRTISYSLGPSGGAAVSSTYDGNTRMSAFTNRDVDQATLAIGTPIDMVLNVAAGRQVLSFPDMNGFFQVVSVEAPAPPRPIQPAVPAQPAQPAVRPATPQETYEYGQVDNNLRPVFLLEFERTPLHGIGTQGILEDGGSGNTGDIYAANAIGTIRLSDRFGLMLGGMFTTYGLRLVQPQWETTLRSYSGNLAAGFSFAQSGHYVYALAFGGYHGITTNIQSYADGRTLDTLFNGGEFGGMAGYEYSRFVRLRVSGSNNPFNPLQVHAYGAIPYTWTPGVYPSIEADFRWMHALAPAEHSGLIGLASVSENAFYVRALASVPTWRLGPVVPIIVGGGEFNISGGSLTSGTGIFGGGLRTDFVRGLEIDVIGASTLHGDPFLTLKLGYAY